MNAKPPRRVSDILNPNTPTSTRKIITKMEVKQSKGNALSEEEMALLKKLMKWRDEGLIELVSYKGWILTEKGVRLKNAKRSRR